MRRLARDVSAGTSLGCCVGRHLLTQRIGIGLAFLRVIAIKKSISGVRGLHLIIPAQPIAVPHVSEGAVSAL